VSARRIAIAAGIVLVLWVIVLRLLDSTLEARQERHVTERIAEALQAAATVSDTDLALVRGRLEMTGLAVRRDDMVGHLALDVAQIRCELPPLGWALVDSECRELAVTGTRLEVSTTALFGIKSPRRPIRTERVVIDDAVLVFSPSAFVPSLGRIAIHIEHAEAGQTVFRTPLSWIFALQQLRASIDLPAGITMRLAYDRGVLSATGTLFGSTPVVVPLVLPVADGFHDGHEEIEALVGLGTEVAKHLVAQRAEDWLKSKLAP
jgi:hypothetical protein